MGFSESRNLLVLSTLRITRWWFQTFLFLLLFGKDSHFDEYFSKGLKPPTRSLDSPNKTGLTLLKSQGSELDLQTTSDLRSLLILREGTYIILVDEM